MAITLTPFLKRMRGRLATENIFEGGGFECSDILARLLAIASGGGFAPTLEYDVPANLTLDLYCRSLISVTQLLPRGAAPAPIKTSKSLNEDEVYIFSYNHDEYLFQEIHVKSMRWLEKIIASGTTIH